MRIKAHSCPLAPEGDKRIGFDQIRADIVRVALQHLGYCGNLAFPVT
jgi:hypothetical protein